MTCGTPCIISASSREREGVRAIGRVPGAERVIVDVVLAVLVGIVRIVSAAWRLAQFEYELAQLVGMGHVVNAFRDDG